MYVAHGHSQGAVFKCMEMYDRPNENFKMSYFESPKGLARQKKSLKDVHFMHLSHATANQKRKYPLTA